MMGRKGITPVIAIVLLLMMTVAAAGMAWVFLQNMINQGQESTTEQFKGLTESATAQIKIISVWKGQNGEIKFTVQNSGSYTYTSTEQDQFKFYLDGAPETTTSRCGIAEPGTTCDVTFAGNTFPTATTQTKVIRVVPPKGNAVTYSCSIEEAGQTYC